jgi:hypothetical protein
LHQEQLALWDLQGISIVKVSIAKGILTWQ